MNPLLLRTALLTLGLAPVLCRAASLSVSPDIVTNDYFGKITLTILGLPSAGQSIRLEKFYDLSTNGVVDAADPLMQSFFITDGVQPILGGATNLNVPGDADATANGQINVVLNYPGLDRAFGLLEGPYRFRVTSPSNTFAPVQQSFTVRQKTYTQSISGLAYDAMTAVGLSNTFVVAYDSSFNPVTAAKANRNGRYTLYVPPGDYTVWPLLNGYLAGQGAWSGTVFPATPVPAANIALTAGPLSLAGKVWDSNAGNGLPGLPVMAYQSNNLVTLAFTDTNGIYTLKVSAADWEVAPVNEALAALGYVGSAASPHTNVTADTTGFNLSFVKANALLSGTLRDNQTPSNLLAGVFIHAEDALHFGHTSGMSYAADGRYSVGVTAGNWWLQPSRETLAPLGCVSAGTNWVELPGSAARVDMVMRKVTAHLAGRLVDDFASPVSSATVRAADATGNWVVTAATDLMGNFDLGVFAGTWRINVDADTAAAWYLIGYDLVRTVSDGQTLSALLYRVRYANGSGTGHVQDSLGHPLSGIGVRGTATLNGTNYSAYAITDSSGSYWMPTLPGLWAFTANCFGYDGLSFQGYECAASSNASVGAGDANVFPALTASPMAPPVITFPAAVQQTNFSFNVSGPTNRTFQILNSTNLANWSSVFATNAPGGSFKFTATNTTTAPHRTFRGLAQ